MEHISPADFDVLEALSDGERNTAGNIAALLNRSRPIVAARLPVLAQYGLVERIGPAPNSDLYVITDQGRTVLENREAYADPDVDFESMVAEMVVG